MDTTAELVEVLKEKAAAGETLLLLVGGQASDEIESPGVSDADSDDSDSFVRVEASDFMPPSMHSAVASSSGNSPPVSQPTQTSTAISGSTAQLPQVVQVGADKVEVTATVPLQPYQPPTTAGTATIQPAAQPVVSAPTEPEAAEQLVAATTAESGAKQSVQQDEKEQQPAMIQQVDRCMPAPRRAHDDTELRDYDAVPPMFRRRRRAAQSAASARQLVATVNGKLSAMKRAVNRVGDRWISEARTVLTPRLVQLWAALSEAMRAVRGAVSARPSLVVVAVVLGLLLLGANVAVKRGGLFSSMHRRGPHSTVTRLEERVATIEQYGRQLLADHSDTTEAIATLRDELAHAYQYSYGFEFELNKLANVVWDHKRAAESSSTAAILDQLSQQLLALETQVEQQQSTINALQFQLNLAEVERLNDEATAQAAKHNTEHSTQQSTHTTAHKRHSWLVDNWLATMEAAQPVKQDDDNSPTDFASTLYVDSIDDLLFAASIFSDVSPQEELQPFAAKQPTNHKAKSQALRAAAASNSPSSALWGEPSRFSSSSAAWSTPSSAESYASAGSTYASSSASTSLSSLPSASSSYSSLFDSERKSARVERAERRERRKQEKEMAESLWTFPHLDTDALSKKAAAASPTTPPIPSSTSTSSSPLSRSSSSRSSTRHPDKLSTSHHSTKRDKPTTTASTCGSQWSEPSNNKKKDKSLKNVGKKIGKALQTVNDAAKRVWKAWKSQW